MYLRKMTLATLILFCIVITTTAHNDSPIHLDKLNVFEDHVTVSGFSAGASMATHMHIAHSSLFSGIAMFSQVFYRCGGRNILEFGIRCSLYGRQVFPYNVANAIRDAQMYERYRYIDPLANLKNDKVFIWMGAQDEYVPLALAKQNKDFYETFIHNPTQIMLTVNNRAKHLLPTKSFGGSCDEDASKNFYLGNCNYSGATHALQFLLGPEVIQIPQNNETYDPESLHLFNQSEFAPGPSIKEFAAMGTQGYIYIPKRCQQGTRCYLHLNFHGCNEWPPTVAIEYIKNSEFLPLAEKNGVIIVFPLTTKTVSNMDGCWDFYSYLTSEFATKNGRQVSVIYAIIQRILHGKLESLAIV